MSVNSGSGNARPLVGHGGLAGTVCEHFRARYKRVQWDCTTRSEGLLLKQVESDEPGRRRQSICERLDDMTTGLEVTVRQKHFIQRPCAYTQQQTQWKSLEAYNYSVRSWQ